MQSRGSVLIYTLLIISGLLVTATALSTLVISNLRQAQSFNDALVAFYAAESGIEHGLYQIRQQDDFAAVAVSGSLPVDSQVTTSLVEDQPSVTFDLSAGQSYQLDLYTSTAGPQYVKSIRLSADTASQGQLVVGWAGWQPNATFNDTYQQAVISASQLDDFLVELAQGANMNSLYFRVRFMALDDDINDIVVTAYSDVAGSDSINVPGRLTISATGRYHRSRQTVIAEMPRKAPLSDLFSYVLFSAEEIVK